MRSSRSFRLLEEVIVEVTNVVPRFFGNDTGLFRTVCLYNPKNIYNPLIFLQKWLFMFDLDIIIYDNNTNFNK